MDDGTSTNPVIAAQPRGAGALDLGDRSPAKPMTVAGYCAECGTWDAHGLVCATCGYDFDGAQTD